MFNRRATINILSLTLYSVWKREKWSESSSCFEVGRFTLYPHAHTSTWNHAKNLKMWHISYQSVLNDMLWACWRCSGASDMSPVATNANDVLLIRDMHYIIWQFLDVWSFQNRMKNKEFGCNFVHIITDALCSCKAITYMVRNQDMEVSNLLLDKNYRAG